MSLKKLNFEDIKKLLIDPWHVLVVDSLVGNTAICQCGEGVYNIVEEVDIDSEASEYLNKLEDERVVFYGSLNCEALAPEFSMPHFFDLWREEAYGLQPDEAYEKAKKIGLAGDYR
ncbi:MAG: hypothetical protein ACJAUK_002431 [Colwellia polaris]|jgi:hypothetical protein